MEAKGCNRNNNNQTIYDYKIRCMCAKALEVFMNYISDGEIESKKRLEPVTLIEMAIGVYIIP